MLTFCIIEKSVQSYIYYDSNSILIKIYIFYNYMDIYIYKYIHREKKRLEGSVPKSHLVLIVELHAICNKYFSLDSL